MGKLNKFNIIVISIMLSILIILCVYIMFFRNKDMNNNNNNLVNNVTNNTVINNNDNSKFIVLDDYCIRINNNRYSKCSTSTVDNKKFNIYVNNVYFGSYKIKYGTVWNLFDDNENYVDYEGNLIAFSNSLDINVIPFSETQFTDDLITQANKVLNSSKSAVESNLHYNHIYSLSNGNNVIITSNLYGQRNNYFNLAYYSNQNSNNIIFKNESNYLEREYTHELKAVLYINNKLNLVFSMLNESTLDNDYSLYKFDGNKFIKVI